MVKVQAGEHNYYLDGYLKANMDHGIEDVKRRNFDMFVLIVGREGFGKSTLAMQLAKYCDPTFSLDRVCFTAEQFLDAVTTAKKFEAIVFDETMGYLSSRGAMSKFNKALIKVMSEMRSKNLFVFLCIPNFFMMDWYVAQHRTTGLLYIKKRAQFASYDYPTKKKMYLMGKKHHDYMVPPNFYGAFVKYFPIDAEAYEVKKQKAIDEFASQKTTSEQWKDQRDNVIKYVIENKFGTIKALAQAVGVSETQLYRITH